MFLSFSSQAAPCQCTQTMQCEHTKLCQLWFYCGFIMSCKKSTFAALFLKSLGSTSSCRSTEVSCETTAASTQRCFETWAGVAQPSWVSSSCGCISLFYKKVHHLLNRPISEVSVFLFLCTFGWWHQKPVIEMPKGKGIILFGKRFFWGGFWFMWTVNTQTERWKHFWLFKHSE